MLGELFSLKQDISDYAAFVREPLLMRLDQCGVSLLGRELWNTKLWLLVLPMPMAVMDELLANETGD